VADQVTYVYRIDENGNTKRGSSQSAFECKIAGAVDPEIVADRVGGGTFRLLVRRGSEMHRRLLVRISGPPKHAGAPESSAPPAPAPPAADAASIATAVASAVASVLDARLPAATAQQRDPFEMAVTLVKLMRDEQKPSAPGAIDAAALTNQMLDMHMRGLKQGQEIAESISNAGGTTVGQALLQTLPRALDVAERVVNAQVAVAQLRAKSPAPAAAPGGAARAAAPGSASHAEVVTSAAETAAPDGAAPWVDVVVSLVARSLERQVEPEDLADTLELMLDPSELALVAAAPDPVVVEQLAAQASRFPALGTPQLGEYVSAVLRALREPADDENDATS
jgi:hypothetical protein